MLASCTTNGTLTIGVVDEEAEADVEGVACICAAGSKEKAGKEVDRDKRSSKTSSLYGVTSVPCEK